MAVRLCIVWLQPQCLAKMSSRRLPVATGQQRKSQVVLKNRALGTQLDGPQIAGTGTIEVTAAIVQHTQVVVYLRVRTAQPRSCGKGLFRTIQVPGSALRRGEILVAVHELRLDF